MGTGELMNSCARLVKSLQVTVITAVLACLSGYSALCQAQPIGAPGWLEAAKSVARPISSTPPVSTQNGPTTTSAFEKANAALVVDGDQTFTEVDFQTAGLYPIKLVRTYNHLQGVGALFDNQWSTNFDMNLVLVDKAGGNWQHIYAIRPDGSGAEYNWNGTNYTNSSPIQSSWINENGTGFTLVFANGSTENYNSSGLVTSTADINGIGYTFTYTTAAPIELIEVVEWTQLPRLRF